MEMKKVIKEIKYKSSKEFIEELDNKIKEIARK